MNYVWEQRKWIDTVDISTEMVDPSSGKYDDMPHIAPRNIESFTGRILDNVRSVKEEQLISGKFRFRPDDVVYGKINPQLRKYFYASVDGLTSADAYVFKGKNGIKQKFLFSLLQTRDFFKYSVSVSKRSGMPKINRDELNAYAFHAPSEEEQNKIGSFLLDLDHFITLHQRKIYIFIKKMPIDWEQRKLGEIATYRNGKAHEANQLDVGTYELVNLNSISIDGGLKPSGKFIEDGGDTLQRNDLVMVLSDVGHGDLLGRVAIIPENNRYVLNQRVALLRINDDTNTYFLFSIINRYQDYFKKLGAGSSQLNISRGIVENFEVTYPNVAEQRMIADYFHSLDHLITLHHRECVILRKMKVNDWEQRKLGEVLVSLQNNTLSRADLSNETGIAKNVHYGDVLIKFGEVLDVSEEKLPMISDKSVLTKYKASFLQNGDVIVADTAEDSTVGKCSEIAGLNDEVVLSGLHTIPYRPIEKFASGYLGYYLNSSAYHKQLIPLMQGIKVTSISKSAMQNTEIVYPKSVEEQGKIGNYFQSLDHLITLHHHEEFCTENVLIYIQINITIQIKEDIMAELESVIEQKTD